MKKIARLLLTLCLVVSLLPLAVLTAEAASETYIKVRLNNAGTGVWDKNVVPGTATKYVTTTAEGVIADGTAENWNIKLEYPADGKPTLTMKGATLKAASGEGPLQITGNADLTVVIETDSSISTVDSGAFYTGNLGLTTITGPGKLSITSTDSYCIQAGLINDPNQGPVLIKDANLELSPSGESTNRMAITFYGGSLTIDNSKIHINGGAKSLGIWGYGQMTVDAATGKITKCRPTHDPGKNDTIKRDLIIQNGSEITGTVLGKYALGANGDVIIKDSTVELTSTSRYTIFVKKPILEGEYTAIGGQKKETAVSYNPSKFSTYLYFKIVPGKVDLIPTEPPVTEPTVPPTTESVPPTTESVPPTTEPTPPPTTEPTPPTTEPATEETTVPPTTQPDQTPSKGGKGLPGVVIALVIIAAVSVLGTGGFAVYWFVIKPKKEAK